MVFTEKHLNEKSKIKPAGYKEFVLARSTKMKNGFYYLPEDKYQEVKKKYGNKTNFLYKLSLFVISIKTIYKNIVRGNKVKVDKQLKKYRLSICKVCPSFVESSQGCQLCGCNMQVKTGIAGMVCPVGKW